MGWGDLTRAFHPVAARAVGAAARLERGPHRRPVGGGILPGRWSTSSAGLIAGEDLWQELKFVPTRVGICILLRELVTIGASIDAARGLPVIHLNFLGYDEQAHRRGPNSAFAHWSLKGIDAAIKRIWNAAHRSSRRDYRVWIYSDHGQESTVPYPVVGGQTIHQAVAQIFADLDAAEDGAASQTPGLPADQSKYGIQYQRSQWLGGGRLRKALFGRLPGLGVDKEHEPKKVLVTAQGPIGHVYPPAAAQRRTAGHCCPPTGHGSQSPPGACGGAKRPGDRLDGRRADLFAARCRGAFRLRPSLPGRSDRRPDRPLPPSRRRRVDPFRLDAPRRPASVSRSRRRAATAAPARRRPGRSHYCRPVRRRWGTRRRGICDRSICGGPRSGLWG